MNTEKPATQHIRQVSTLTRLSQLSPYLLVFFCLAFLGMFTLLGIYAHPSSDDFCLAAGINREGLLTHLWKHYIEWSGRYSANALYAIYPLIFGLFEGYKFIPPLLLISLISACAFFLSSLFRINITAPAVLVSSFIFVTLFVAGMMSTASGLYWMAGALTYQSANILLLVALALMIRLLDQQHQSKPDFSTFSLLLIVIIMAMGTNETSMLAILTVLVVVCILQLHFGMAKVKPWLFILSIAMICFAIVFFSPGNAIRAADFPLRHDLSRSLAGSLMVGAKILGSWLSSPLLLASSVLAPYAVFAMYRDSKVTFTVSKPLIAILFGYTLAIPVCMQFPAWWAMGGWPPARTIDAIYFVFLISWFLTLGAVTLFFVQRKSQSSAVWLHHSAAAIIFLSASVVFTLSGIYNKNSQLAWDDLMHHARPFHEYMTARYQLISYAQLNQKASLIVPDYHRQYPRSIYFNDIMHHSRHWRNVCYADYFGLQRIKRDRF